MKLNPSAPPLVISLCLLIASCLPAVTQSQPAPAGPHGAPHDAQTDAAFDDFYNMQYDRATAELEKIVDKHPEDPFAVNHLLTVILMHDLYDTGATTPTTVSSAARPAPPTRRSRTASSNWSAAPRISKSSNSRPTLRT